MGQPRTTNYRATTQRPPGCAPSWPCTTPSPFYTIKASTVCHPGFTPNLPSLKNALVDLQTLSKGFGVHHWGSLSMSDTKPCILLIGHLLDNFNLLSYKDLQKHYILPHRDLYQYLRINHILGSIFKSDILVEIFLLSLLFLHQTKKASPISTHL